MACFKKANVRQAFLVLLLLVLACFSSGWAQEPADSRDANSVGAFDTIHVDDDSRNDPRHWDSRVSDPCENGTSAHPYDAIQEAIDAAADGATIFVHGGRYCETIDLLGKRITLTGFDPNHHDVAAWPVIDGIRTGPVVSLTRGEDANCVISGFVITGGRGRSAGAILCASSSPTITHCLIAGNRATDPDGATVRCTNSVATFVNCTISGNHAGPEGAALHVTDSNVAVVNSILWGNTPAEILVYGVSQPVIRRSDVAGGWRGQGCIDADPLFADVGGWEASGQPGVKPELDDPNALWLMGDYHLRSQMGRYISQRRTWVLDRVTSPCIDAGDPCSPVGAEPSPNGGVINMGVYGGTTEASKSWPDGPVHFPDANLKAAVEEELWIVDPTPADMLGLTQLNHPNTYSRENAITRLDGLEYALNLQELNLRYNAIRDLSPLAGLSNLHTLMLLGNYISDISPLAGLSDLQMLDLEQNNVESISALGGLSSLESIGLHRNFVRDISPLANLTRLTWVDLRALPMNEEAYTTYLRQIEANNPGVTLLYDAFFTGRLVVSSTDGGSVTRPGEGVFTYPFYEVVLLEAVADPGFEFVGWSGSYSTTENPLSLVMDQDYDLRANFQSTTDPGSH